MLFTALNPKILSILGNILIISKLTNLQSDVNVLLLFKLSNSYQYQKLCLEYNNAIFNNKHFLQSGVVNHFLDICCSSASKFEYLQVQLIEKVSLQNDDDIDKVLWEREKYWQFQLFKIRHWLNNPNEWYGLNRRGYRE